MVSPMNVYRNFTFEICGLSMSICWKMEDGRRNNRGVKGRCVLRSLARIMRERNVSMDVKKLKEQYSPVNIGSETCIWNKAWHSRVCTVEMGE